jgi:hypothetical protein
MRITLSGYSGLLLYIHQTRLKWIQDKTGICAPRPDYRERKRIKCLKVLGEREFYFAKPKSKRFFND